MILRLNKERVVKQLIFFFVSKLDEKRLILILKSKFQHQVVLLAELSQNMSCGFAVLFAYDGQLPTLARIDYAYISVVFKHFFVY